MNRGSKAIIMVPLALTACSSATLHQRAVEHNDRAVELIEAGSLRQARASLEVALEYNPRFSEAHANLGLVDIREGHLEVAELRLQRAVLLNPDFAEAWTNLASISLERDNAEEAIVRARQAVEVDPDFAEARVVLIRALLTQQLVEAAAEQAQRLLAVRPDDARSHAVLAMVALERQLLDEAETEVEAALEIDENHLLALEIRGRLRLLQGDPRAAAVDLEIVVAAQPDDTDLRYFLGLALLQAGAVDRAETLLRQVLRRRPAHARALAALAVIFAARGSRERAAECLEASLTAHPGLPEALALQRQLEPGR
jgi:tetratricopeptide (TPR) repeat protein